MFENISPRSGFRKNPDPNPSLFCSHSRYSRCERILGGGGEPQKKFRASRDFFLGGEGGGEPQNFFAVRAKFFLQEISPPEKELTEENILSSPLFAMSLFEPKNSKLSSMYWIDIFCYLISQIYAMGTAHRYGSFLYGTA